MDDKLESVKLPSQVVKAYREMSEMTGKPIQRLMYEVLMTAANIFKDGQIAGLKAASAILESK